MGQQVTIIQDDVITVSENLGRNVTEEFLIDTPCVICRLFLIIPKEIVTLRNNTSKLQRVSFWIL